jgi:hypothetical protein
MSNTAASKPSPAPLSIVEAQALARTLCRTLRTKSGAVRITTRVEVYEELRAVRHETTGRMGWRNVETAHVVFEGGAHGSHALQLDVSSRERVLAHFAGYCENNGCERPFVGQTVEFPSASAWRAGGYRRGRVVAVGHTRATVTYKFAHGGETSKAVSFHELRLFV